MSSEYLGDRVVKDSKDCWNEGYYIRFAQFWDRDLWDGDYTLLLTSRNISKYSRIFITLRYFLPL